MPTDGEIQLRDYLDCRIEDHCGKNDLWQKGHMREHELIEEQIRLARNVLEVRLEALNEWKNRSIEDRGMFLTHAEYEAKHCLLETALTTVAEKNQLTLAAKAVETKSDLQLLEEKQQATQTWVRNLLVAVLILTIGVIADLLVMLVIWRM